MELRIFIYQETFSSSKKKKKKLGGEEIKIAGNQKIDHWNLNYPGTNFNSAFLNWWRKNTHLREGMDRTVKQWDSYKADAQKMTSGY